MELLTKKKKMEQITLFKHITDGGAIYLTDNHRFADARVIIRLDGGAELSRCDVAAFETAPNIFKVTKTETSSEYVFIEAADKDRAETHAVELQSESWHQNQDFDSTITKVEAASIEELKGRIIEKCDGTYYNYYDDPEDAVNEAEKKHYQFLNDNYEENGDKKEEDTV